VVLPLSLRRKLRLDKGDKLILVAEKDKLTLHPVKDMSPAELEEELHVMKRAAAGLNEIEKGNSETVSAKEFKKRLRSWLGLSPIRKTSKRPSVS
jgi:bifunctional DNA-binding transcriptional regulator/antitoxin component of YhaV-PrlF toxin-antitoxin module